jgi:hypothetical protein
MIRVWVRMVGDGGVPALFVVIYSHDDSAGGLREGDGGIENEAAAADLGDAIVLPMS